MLSEKMSLKADSQAGVDKDERIYYLESDGSRRVKERSS